MENLFPHLSFTPHKMHLHQAVCAFAWVIGPQLPFGFNLKIRPHRKRKLIYEDLLESADVVLLIKDQHGFFVVD